MPPTAILDIDGTLVDTNYQHVVAWARAFAQHDIMPALWQVHRHRGMGGDKLVEAVTNARTEREHGASLRDAEKILYSQLIGEVRPLADARRLLEILHRRAHPIVLASSAKDDEVEHYVDLLDARELANSWTTSADVEATKPEPDLVLAALERGGGGPAVMLGDTPWDCEAAGRAGVPIVGLLTGGFSENELRDAGAGLVYERLADLIDELDETPFAAS